MISGKTCISENTKPLGLDDEIRGAMAARAVARRSAWETTVGTTAASQEIADAYREADDSVGYHSDGFRSDDSLQLEPWSSDDDSGGPLERYIDKESERLARQLQEEEYILAKADSYARSGVPDVGFQGEERTLEAIAAGTAVMAQCIHCQRWMQVAENVKLMFCPVCKVVSPVHEQQTGVKIREDERQILEDHKLAERLQKEEREQGRIARPQERQSPLKNRRCQTEEMSCQVEQSEERIKGHLERQAGRVANSSEKLRPTREGDRTLERENVFVTDKEIKPIDDCCPAADHEETGTLTGRELSDRAVASPLNRGDLAEIEADRESERFARELQKEEYALAAAEYGDQSLLPESDEEKEGLKDSEPCRDPADESETASPQLRIIPTTKSTASSDVIAELRSERTERMIRKGLCPTCGRRLYEVKKSGGLPFRRGKSGKTTKKALTIEGEVVRGQCLHCTKQEEAADEVVQLGEEAIKKPPNKNSKVPQTRDSLKYTYKGRFDEEGNKQGHGILQWSNGDMYEGEFKNDLMEGQGKLVLMDGSEYVGQWKANKMHGKGTRRFASGNVYTGNYTEGERSGYGTLSFANGDVYGGEWANDVMDGHGQYFYNNGHCFEGTFRNGKREGSGKYRFVDGPVDICVYRNDKREGFGVRWSANRKKAWKLLNGKVKGKISLEEAKRIEAKCGMPAQVSRA